MKHLFHTLILAGLMTALWLIARSPSARTAPVAGSSDSPDPSAILTALPAVPDLESGRRRAAAADKARATPGDPKAWVALGDALAQEFRDTAQELLHPHAEAAYARALELHPRSMEALAGMAWVAGVRHEFPVSIMYAEQALALDPQSPAALGIIGDAHLELGHYEEAADAYQKMMDARPDLSSWSRGAHLLWITGNKTKALWLMEKAIRAGAPFAENTGWCRARLAMMLLHDGALLPAQQVLDPALQSAPRHAFVLLAAGRIAAARGEFDAAAAHYRRLLEAGPHMEALAALGDVLAAKGDTAGAEECWLAVEKMHEEHSANHKTGSHSHLAMARFFADHDRRLPEALRLVNEAALTRNVQDADTVAWVYFKNGNLSGAVSMMKRALQQNTPDAAMRYHAGVIAAAAGDRAAAVRRLQEALSMNPQFDPIHAPLARKALDELSASATTAAR